MVAEHPYRQPNVDVSGAVRSIRVAAALSERYAVISRAKTYQSPEELSNTIGEARQLYPEIWANLDDARDVLVRQGIAMAEYNALRAKDATRAGGVLDVQAVDRVVARPLDGNVVKSARMNYEGHALAVEACAAMRRALPSVDWDGLDRAEAAEIAAAGSLRPAKWKAIVLGLFCFVLIGAAIGAYAYMRFASKPAERRPFEIHLDLKP